MSTKQLTSVIFYLTVFLTGAAVLVFEVSAVRLLAPYFGGSLYVLSSVLSIILAALSLGYFFGGRIADRYPHFLPLYFLIISAGILMLVLLNLSNFALPLAQDFLTLKTGPLIMAFCLFFLPAFLLGVDSPYIIKLLSETDSDRKHSGAIVGSTFFWSTVGSIFGSVATGFFLIPQLGLNLTIALTAILLVIYSAIAICFLNWIETNQPKKIPWRTLLTTLATILALGILLFTLSFNPPAHNKYGKVLFETDGFYSNIMVFEEFINGQTYRFLKRDVNNSSAIQLGSQRPVFGYAQLVENYSAMVPDATSYLVLGGGAYTIPRQIFYLDPNIEISVVEIEPKLLPIAYDYFELPKSERIVNYEQDARIFLNQTNDTYDVIVSDVMNSGYYIPPHLATVEYLKALKAALTTDGVAYINTISVMSTDQESLMGSITKTITSVFPNHKAIAIKGTNHDGIQNIVYVVRHENKPIILDNQYITDVFNTRTPATAIADLVIDTKQIDLSQQTIFTDNQSTIERLVASQFLNL